MHTSIVVTKNCTLSLCYDCIRYRRAVLNNLLGKACKRKRHKNDGSKPTVQTVTDNNYVVWSYRLLYKKKNKCQIFWKYNCLYYRFRKIFDFDQHERQILFEWQVTTIKQRPIVRVLNAHECEMSLPFHYVLQRENSFPINLLSFVFVLSE